MNLKYTFKIFTLSLALTMTIYAIYLLNTNHLNDFWTSLGFNGSQKNLSWCTNRLSSLQGLGSNLWSLKEQNNNWLLTQPDGSQKIVDYLDIEKWLAKYCSLKISIYTDVNLLDLKFKPYAKAQFNDSQQALIYINERGIYQINEIVFKSEEMHQALQELRTLLKI